MHILFVHGCPGDARVFAPVIDALPAGTDARAITLGYFGKTQWRGDGSDFGTSLHAREICELTEATMEPPVHLVAWSFGCHPALLAAIERPGLFASLFLYEPSLASYVVDDAARAAFDADCAAAFPPVMTAMQHEGAEAALTAMLDNSGGDGWTAALTPERRAVYFDSLPVLPLLFGGGEPPADISAEDLRRIACPVTAACGSATRPMFAVPAHAVAAAARWGRVEIVEGADHMLPENDPRRFAEVLSHALAGMPA